MPRDSKIKGWRAEYRRKDLGRCAEKQEVVDAPRSTTTIPQYFKTFPWIRNYAPKDVNPPMMMSRKRITHKLRLHMDRQIS